jgi:hypothetical protein
MVRDRDPVLLSLTGWRRRIRTTGPFRAEDICLHTVLPPEGWKRLLKKDPVYGGTGSSNPALSSGESSTNSVQTFGPGI